MSERLEHRPTDFVGVTPNGKFIFVGMAKREEFDKIAATVTDHGQDANGHVLSKAIEGDGIYVIFQYWLKSRTIEALSADLAAEKARKVQS
jgi:hypothetical protein